MEMERRQKRSSLPCKDMMWIKMFLWMIILTLFVLIYQLKFKGLACVGEILYNQALLD